MPGPTRDHPDPQIGLRHGNQQGKTVVVTTCVGFMSSREHTNENNLKLMLKYELLLYLLEYKREAEKIVAAMGG